MRVRVCVQRTYAEANNGFYDGSGSRDKGTSLSKDDRIHGSLLIINELIMNAAWSDGVRDHQHICHVHDSRRNSEQ